MAKYADVALSVDADLPHVRKPVFVEDYKWTDVCSSLDTNCLACEPL